MGWGTGGWGTEGWGVGTTTEAPTLVGVSPGLLDVEGGDVITIVGSNFYYPVVVEVLQAGNVVGTCYMFDPEFDLTASRLLMGSPSLPTGTYDLRVSTNNGFEATLANALTYKVFAEEARAHAGRGKWASAWLTGPNYLR
jgi:hypothetical protein